MEQEEQRCRCILHRIQIILIRARPAGAEAGSREGKKGSDKGIDGVIAFVDDNTDKAKRV